MDNYSFSFATNMIYFSSIIDKTILQIVSNYNFLNSILF